MTRYLSLAGLLSIVAGLLLGRGLASPSLWTIGATLFALDACWAMGASMSAWLCSIYPVRVRYSGFAFSFNTGGLIGGAVIPIIAQMISAAGGLTYAGLLVSASGALLFAAVTLFRRPSEETTTAIAEPAAAA
jgi:hypothetical protein